jgi:phosphatidylserine synthase
VPVVCLGTLAPVPPGTARIVWWLAGFAYAACAITRLGFYNLTHASGAGFIGLPAPVAALIWSSVLLTTPSAVWSGVVFLACGIAMVSPLPIPRPAGAGLAAFVLWPVALLIAHLR